MEFFKNKTPRGFSNVDFIDRYEQECSIQKSSLAFEDAIWLGITNVKPQIMASHLREDLTGWVDYPIPDDVLISSRMHLTREQIAELLPTLQHFAKTGEVRLRRSRAHARRMQNMRRHRSIKRLGVYARYQKDHL